MREERVDNLEEGFQSNIEELFQQIQALGQISEKQREILHQRFTSLSSMTVQQKAEFQRDLASWFACWNILLDNTDIFMSEESKKALREGRFFEALKDLTGEKNPKPNTFIDEATQFINLKRITQDGKVV